MLHFQNSKEIVYARIVLRMSAFVYACTKLKICTICILYRFVLSKNEGTFDAGQTDIRLNEQLKDILLFFYLVQFFCCILTSIRKGQVMSSIQHVALDNRGNLTLCTVTTV